MTTQVVERADTASYQEKQQHKQQCYLTTTRPLMPFDKLLTKIRNGDVLTGSRTGSVHAGLFGVSVGWSQPERISCVWLCWCSDLTLHSRHDTVIVGYGI